MTHLHHVSAVAESVAPAFNYPRRAARRGAEADLVDCSMPLLPIAVPVGFCLSVFREARLECGFPDIIAVVWRPSATTAWPACRQQLTSVDLRLLQLVSAKPRVHMDEARKYFGARCHVHVGRLEEAGLIVSSGLHLRRRPRRDTFAVRDIIAIEAKLSATADALAQASRNTWFASRSYVLLPSRPSGLYLQRARALGLGVMTLSGERAYSCLGAKRLSLPRSYASWMMNEWAWRESVASAADVD